VTWRNSAARLKLRVCASAKKSSNHLSCMALSSQVFLGPTGTK
jgi:hypothetical protein